MTAMRRLLRKLCSASVPILGKGRAFSSSSSSTSMSPLLLVPSRNLFSGEKNGKLSESCYPYCLFSLADLSAGDDTNKKKVLLPKEKLLPQDKELLFPDDLRYIGSSEGLVACLHPRSLKVFLFNPLSPSNSITLLPPIPDLSALCIRDLKLIMSAPPSDPNCRVLVLNSVTNGTCFWAPGDESWTPIEARDGDAWTGGSDIVYSKSGGCFYHSNDGWILVAWDLSDPASPRSKIVMTDFDYVDPAVDPELYLAESPSSGDLCLVCRSMWGAKTEITEALEETCEIDPRDSHWRLGLSPENIEHDFRVFKLDLEHSRWAETYGFDDALFLGKNHSFFSPSLPNSIYFTEKNYFSYNQVLAFDPDRHRVCDMLIKDPRRGRPSWYYFRDSEEKGTDLNPIWVMPQSSTSTASLVERFVHTCQFKPPPPPPPPYPLHIL